MMRMRSFSRLVLTAAAAATLSGCVSLLPRSEPAHVYRFGQPLAAEALKAPQGSVGVFRASSTFQRESAGDQLLTLTNGKAAYVAETRWIAPASVLWDEAVLAAFDADHGPVRIISRGEPVNADYILRLDVRNFEAIYDQGAEAPPTVVVRVRAAISGGKDRASISDKIFEKRVTATENRVGAIVPAYDRAVAEVLAEIVEWTTQQAKPL